MRFEFIFAHRTIWPIRVSCRVLEVSRDGYYAWVRSRPRREEGYIRDKQICAAILRIWESSYKSYGAPRILICLQNEGIRIGRTRLDRLMKEAGVIGLAALRKKKGITKAGKKDARPKDLVNRNFTPAESNRVWASDIKQIRTLKGWLYLAIVMDLYNREIIGWSLRKDMNQSIVSEALRMALKRRRIDWAGFRLVFHSDRGSQYTAEDTRRQLLRAGIRASVGKVACCFDNAVSESFFHSLEVECIQKQVYATQEEARTEVFTWVEGFYNRTRLHSTLGYLSPQQFLAKNRQLDRLQIAA